MTTKFLFLGEKMYSLNLLHDLNIMTSPDLLNSEKIYHYTDIYGLRGLIIDKKMWLGNLRQMNDSQEEFYFMQHLKEAVLNTKREITPEQLKALESLFNLETEKLKTAPAYVACFSRLKDDASQWERYADKGTGFCIEFNTCKFNEFMKGSMFLQPVYYINSMESHTHVKNLVHYLEYNSIPSFSNINSLMSNVRACASSYKHPSFAQEEEIRLILLPEFISYTDGKIIYNISSGIIKRIFELDIKELESKQTISFYDTIDGIYIGPKSKQDKNILYEYFKSNMVNIPYNKIKISESPLQ